MLRMRLSLLGMLLALSWQAHATVFDLEELREEVPGVSSTGPKDPSKVRKRTNYGPRYYAEAALGNSTAGISVDKTSSGISSSYSDFDNFVSTQLLAGYRFYRVKGVSVALEAFYTDLGDTDGNTSSVISTQLVDGATLIDRTLTTKTQVDLQNYGVGFNVGMNIFPRLQGHFRVGAHRWDADYSISIIDTRLGNVGGVFSPQSSEVKLNNEDSSTDLYLGLGLSYKALKRFYITVDYAKYYFDFLDANGELSKEEYIETFSARVGYRF